MRTIEGVRTEQLSAVLVIARTSSMRAAAAELGMSQSALSESVRRLERELGLTLLDRSSAGTHLSAGGRAVLDRVTAVCRAADELTLAARATSADPAVLRITAVTSAINTVLPASLHDVAVDRGFEIDLRIAGSDDVVEQVARQHAEVGVIACEHGAEPSVDGVVVQPLLQSQLGLAMAHEHRLGELTDLTRADLRGERMIRFGEGYLMHRVSERVLDGLGTRTVTHVASTPEAMRLVAAGVGVCVVPQFSVGADVGIVWRPIVDVSRPIALALVFRSRVHQSSIHRQVMDLIIEHGRRFR